MNTTTNLAASAAFTTGLLFVAAAAAVAQDTPPGTDDLEEVIVSSRRHPEPLFESPAAISVLTEEQIESAGVHGPGDIAVGIPNVTITPSSRAGEAFITIRGIAQSRAADSTVAVIIDGVQQGTPEEFNQELYNLESIEVLKGPQGALYGRNAIAGAIVIKTKEPSNSLRAKATVGFGNSAQVKAVGSLDLPLIEDRAGLRVSGFHSANDGYFRNR